MNNVNNTVDTSAASVDAAFDAMWADPAPATEVAPLELINAAPPVINIDEPESEVVPEAKVETVAILGGDFIVKANEIANKLVDESEALRAAGDQKAICTRADIICAIATATGNLNLPCTDKDGQIDTLKVGTFYDALRAFGCFPGFISVKGPYGGIQRPKAEKPTKKSKKDAKADEMIEFVI